MELISKLEIFEDKFGGTAVIQTSEGRYKVKYKRNIFTRNISIVKKESTDEEIGIQELNHILPSKKIKRNDSEVIVRDEFDAVDTYFDYSFISRKLQAPIFSNKKLINKIVKIVKKSRFIDKNEFANRMRSDFIADCIIFNNYGIDAEIDWGELGKLLQKLDETKLPIEKNGFTYRLKDLKEIYQIINKLEVLGSRDHQNLSRRKIIRELHLSTRHLYRISLTTANTLLKFSGPLVGLLLTAWLYKNFSNNLNFGVSLLSKLNFSQIAYYIGYKSLTILFQSFLLTITLFAILWCLRFTVNWAFKVLQVTDNYKMFRGRFFFLGFSLMTLCATSLLLAEGQIVATVLSLLLSSLLALTLFAPELLFYRIFTAKIITLFATLVTIVNSLNIILTEFDHSDLSLGKSCGFYNSSGQIKYYQYFITNSWQDKVEIVFLSGSSTEWLSNEPKNINTFYTVPKSEVELLSDCSMVKDFKIFKEENENSWTKRDCGLVGNAGYIESRGLGSNSQKYLKNPSDGSCIEILQ